MHNNNSYLYNCYIYRDIFKINVCFNIISDSQPSTLERILAIANEHCRARNELLVSLNNLNDTGSSSTDLLIRRILSTVDGKYTTWIAYIGK